jgi:hypothetical protein
MHEPPDFDTDTAISADLDGEFDEFAAELNLDASELRALLTARPDYGDRRDALELARSSLRAPVEPLDELARARLLAGAGVAGSNPPTIGARDRGWGARLAVAAAVAVFLLGGAVLLINRGGSEDNAKSASTASGSVRSGKLGDIGAIDQAKLDRLIGGPPSAPTPAADRSTAAASGDTTRQRQSAARSGVPDSAVAGFDAQSGAKATAEQLRTCENEYATNGPLRFSATGAYSGRAAVVLGIANGERTIVFVVAADDCPTVLFSVSR